jgi:uncharacterized protein (DUF58 family)
MNWDQSPRLKRAWLVFVALVITFMTASLAWSLYYGQSLRSWALLAILSLILGSLVRALLIRVIKEPTTRNKTKLTSEGKFLLGALLFIGLLGMNTGSNLLYLGFGALLSALIVSRVASEFGLRGLRVRRITPTAVTCGQEVKVEIWLRNERRTSSHYGLVVQEDWEWAGPNAGIFFPSVGAGETVGGYLPLTFPNRGEAKLSRLIVRSSFPLGLLEKISYVEFEATILVLPRVYQLSARILNKLKVTGVEQGAPSLIGLERWDMIRNLRDYRAGDQLRRIHWRSSAKRQTLQVREYERPIPQRLLLVLYGPAVDNEAAWEAAVSLTASMIQKLARSEEHVALVAHSSQMPEKLTIGDGATVADAMEVLALANSGGSVDSLIQLGRNMVKGRRAIIITSASPSDPSLAKLKLSLGDATVCSTIKGLSSYTGDDDES